MFCIFSSKIDEIINCICLFTMFYFLLFILSFDIIARFSLHFSRMGSISFIALQVWQIFFFSQNSIEHIFILILFSLAWFCVFICVQIQLKKTKVNTFCSFYRVYLLFFSLFFFLFMYYADAHCVPSTWYRKKEFCSFFSLMKKKTSRK